MREPTVRLQFPRLQAAYEAFETLQELGYRPELAAEDECRPQIDIHIENNDVQSALEIAHAFDGHLLEQGQDRPARIDFDPEDVSIPAHVVSEDFPDSYMNGASNNFIGDEYDVVREIQEGYRDSVY